MNVETGSRYNEGKLKWSYVPFKALEPMVRVLMFGAEIRMCASNKRSRIRNYITKYIE